MQQSLVLSLFGSMIIQRQCDTKGTNFLHCSWINKRCIAVVLLLWVKQYKYPIISSSQTAAKEK